MDKLKNLAFFFSVFAIVALVIPNPEFSDLTSAEVIVLDNKPRASGGWFFVVEDGTGRQFELTVPNFWEENNFKIAGIKDGEHVTIWYLESKLWDLFLDYYDLWQLVYNEDELIAFEDKKKQAVIFIRLMWGLSLIPLLLGMLKIIPRKRI